MLFNPKVSIIIQVYNVSNYLNDAIESALAQTYKNLEIVVINNGNLDDGETKKVASSYGDKISYFEKENDGVARALNCAIAKTTGEYFSLLSHDHIYLPTKLEEQVKAIIPNKDVIITCNVDMVSFDRKSLTTNKLPADFNNSVRSFLALDTTMGINACSLLIPKKLFEKYGGFNERLKYTYDDDLWFRIAGEVPFIVVDKNLVLSRQHELRECKEKNEIRTIEADRLRYNFLKHINYSDFKNYFHENIDHCEKTYQVYLKNGYKKTAAAIFIYLLEMHKEKLSFTDFCRLINKEIVGSENVSSNRDVWKELFSGQSKPSEKPTLLFYSDYWGKGGLERVLATLFIELSKKYNIIFISNNHKSVNCFEIPKNIKHILIDEKLEKRLPYSLLLLNLLFKVDIFIGNPHYIYNFFDTYLLLNGVVKTVAINHGYYFLPYSSPASYPIVTKKNQIYGNVSAVVWLTHYGAGIYKYLFNNGALIPNPLPFNTNENIINKNVHNTILCVGRFDDHIKRLDLILRVFKKVFSKNREAKLCIVGRYNLNQIFPQSNEKTLRELLDELNIPKNSIQWEGEQEQVDNYYKNSNVFMFTSDSEGFGMVLLEAGLFGLPAVLFEINGIDDIIKHEVNGYIIEKNNLDEMADKILFLLSTEEAATKMGIAANMLAKRFDKKIISSKWSSLFNILLATDDQNEINKRLSEEFSPKIDHMNEFMTDVVTEYEQNIMNILEAINISHLNYQSNIEQIHNSTSWKITKPLRWTKTVFMSLKDSAATYLSTVFDERPN